jgi:peptidoglycan/LPS O-acetylase OafA/YrhL
LNFSSLLWKRCQLISPRFSIVSFEKSSDAHFQSHFFNVDASMIISKKLLSAGCVPFRGLARLPEHLRRITSSNRFIPEIDGLRFTAIISVIFYHIDLHLRPVHAALDARNDLLHQILSTGFFGVQLFFAISGFILSLPFAEQYLAGGQKVDLKRYFVRRVTRLEPPYIISMLIYFCMEVFISRRWTVHTLMPHLLASLFYIHNIVCKYASAVNPVAWSLEIEIQFYILAPLLALIYTIQSRMTRRLLLVVIASIFAYRSVLNPTYPISIVDFLQYFLVGFLLSDVYVVDWQEKRANSHIWDVVASLAWLILGLMLVKKMFAPMLAILCIFLAYAGAFRGRFWNKLFRLPWIVVIGGMCYTIYLYHPILMVMGMGITQDHFLNPVYAMYVSAQIVCLLPYIIAVSIVLFMLAERPFMDRDWPSKFLRWLSNILRLSMSR